MEPDQSVIEHDLVTEDDATRATEQILSQGDVDALMIDNNQLCTGVLQSPTYARRRPETLSFDNFALAPQFGITVIDSNPYEMGRTGAQLLFERLAERSRPPQHVRVPASLMVNDDPIY
ncbi:substrate-binding domain-containing protein [Microlunatus sp. Gsoil 973]|uniref:substrate-binding domain-containing protein n=1 Tax=Microlunatus sp. Gsoil 973 TaxID=2672569 RepID=UPI001E5F6989|nr:substrate-binding domain-containing protein [Microlunatus sp. Gsoil 973]